MLNAPIPTKREPIEVGISAFVAEQYRELGIAVDPAELFC
jgi:hypothetical protein